MSMKNAHLFRPLSTPLSIRFQLKSQPANIVLSLRSTKSGQWWQNVSLKKMAGCSHGSAQTLENQVLRSRTSGSLLTPYMVDKFEDAGPKSGKFLTSSSVML